MKTLVAVAAGICRIRLLVWTVAAGAVLWFAMELFRERPAEQGALPALTVFLWAALLLGVSYSFPSGPPAIEVHDNVRQTLRKRFAQMVFWLLAAVTLGVAAMLVYLTSRSVGLIVS